MKTYRQDVICQTLYTLANSEDEAEAKYNAYHLGDFCPDHPDQFTEDCGCVTIEEEVSHLTTEED